MNTDGQETPLAQCEEHRTDSNVVSILGGAYERPFFKDKRRSTLVEFKAQMNDGSVRLTSGSPAPLGLVLHRSHVSGAWDRAASPGAAMRRWTVSEPQSGGAVAHGPTRQAALDALAERVAYLGGVEAFRRELAAAMAAFGRCP